MAMSRRLRVKCFKERSSTCTVSIIVLVCGSSAQRLKDTILETKCLNITYDGAFLEASNKECGSRFEGRST